MKDILVIGAGYVGLTTAVGLALLGHKVICVDKDPNKIDALNLNHIPIYEPELAENLNKVISLNNLIFTTDLETALKKVNIVFLAVWTPERLDGSANLDDMYDVVKQLVSKLDKDIFLVIKSTVPAGTNEKISTICKSSSRYNIHIISNPEFLREGTALYDFFNPARIIVGAHSSESEQIMREIYKKFVDSNIPFIFTDPNSAELAKYASNCFLATKIAFINEISDLCEFYNANIEDVSYMMGLDDRIGEKFLKTGPGFGGSCFPKDILALRFMARAAGQMSLTEAVIDSNINRMNNMAAKINKILENSEKKIAVLGVSYKANTDDVRSSPAVNIIQKLLDDNFTINLYDPIALENAKKIFNNRVNYSTNISDAANDINAIVILTEWEEFANFNYEEIYNNMKAPVIIDLRNILDPKLIKSQGFKYYNLGTKI